MAKLIDRDEVIVGATACETARQKARYGHTAWITWMGTDGAWRSARATAASVKAAMLASGTQGHVVLYHASEQFGSLITWPLACILLSNLRYWDVNPASTPKGFC